jgi:hypothetical protein
MVIVATPRALVPDNAGLSVCSQEILRPFDPDAGGNDSDGREASWVNAKEPVNAGAEPLGVIITPKASESILMVVPLAYVALRTRVTGMLTVPPGAPEAPLVLT